MDGEHPTGYPDWYTGLRLPTYRTRLGYSSGAPIGDARPIAAAVVVISKKNIVKRTKSEYLRKKLRILE